MLPFAIRHLLGMTRQYAELRALWPQIQDAARDIRSQFPSEIVDEMALPSYTHPNRLMRHLFWERLAVALEWVDGLSVRPKKLLDFGCGLGILFPTLAHRGIQVIGCDINAEVARIGATRLGARHVEVLNGQQDLGVLASGSIDAVLALDVLEHVEAVPSLAEQFSRILTEHGRLLCSLPTENVFYRIGRAMAGFSGAYHVHHPAEAVMGLRTHLTVRRVGRLYPFLPLFDFFEAYT